MSHAGNLVLNQTQKLNKVFFFSMFTFSTQYKKYKIFSKLLKIFFFTSFIFQYQHKFRVKKYIKAHLYLKNFYQNLTFISIIIYFFLYFYINFIYLYKFFFISKHYIFYIVICF